jgi:hypothetical protein
MVKEIIQRRTMESGAGRAAKVEAQLTLLNEIVGCFEISEANLKTNSMDEIVCSSFAARQMIPIRCCTVSSICLIVSHGKISSVNFSKNYV